MRNVWGLFRGWGGLWGWGGGSAGALCSHRAPWHFLAGVVFVVAHRVPDRCVHACTQRAGGGGVVTPFLSCWGVKTKKTFFSFNLTCFFNACLFPLSFSPHSDEKRMRRRVLLLTHTHTTHTQKGRRRRAEGKARHTEERERGCASLCLPHPPPPLLPGLLSRDAEGVERALHAPAGAFEEALRCGRERQGGGRGVSASGERGGRAILRRIAQAHLCSLFHSLLTLSPVIECCTNSVPPDPTQAEMRWWRPPSSPSAVL